MNKVLVLSCGGTLVMEKNEEGVLQVPPKEKAIENLRNLEPNIHKIADITINYVENIDSTNMEPEVWDRLTAAIVENYDEYTGFVITHGTDSMAYTSSALSYTLPDIGKPVVLTGAQIPGTHIETDARRNFVNAVRLATMDISGINVVFNDEVILGSRASKISESKLDAFDTINWGALGEIRIDVRLSEKARPRHDKPVHAVKGFEPNIAIVRLVPGTPVDTLTCLLDSGVRGLVLRGYGAGNIAYKYLEVLEKAKEMRIPVVVTTPCLEGATLMHVYDVGNQALKRGAIQAHDMTIESATTKLMWALKHAESYEQVIEIMHTNYTGEIDLKCSPS
jgi:L-asparaginase